MIGEKRAIAPRAQIVAMREPARQNDDVGALEIGVLVPDVLGLLAEHILGRVIRVLIAVGAGKDDDGKFHTELSAVDSSRQLRSLKAGHCGPISTCLVNSMR